MMRRFGEKLRVLRKKSGMTTVELAAALGYAANSHISQIETGKRKPTAELVFKVARLFHVTMEQLMDDEMEVG